MAFFQKRSSKISVDLSLLSIQCQKPQEGIYYITISKRKQQWKSHTFSLASDGVTNIQQTFNFPSCFLTLKDGTSRSKFLKLKLVQKQKSTKKVIATWKYDFKNLQHQHYLSLQLSPKNIYQDMGNISLSFIISDHSKNSNLPNLNSHELSNNTLVADFAEINIQDQINFSEFNLSYTSSETSSFLANLSCTSSNKSFLICNQSTQKIASICDELINNDIEQIKSFPTYSKNIAAEIIANISNFESIFFVFRWSDTLSRLKQKNISRKIYGLISTIHLISILQQKQILSNDDLNVIINSFTELYYEVLSSILENAKLYLENENQITEFCFNLLDQLNQIGSGIYCNTIYSSLLLEFVLSVPDELSDIFCQNLFVSKIEKNRMKKENIDSISILLKNHSLDE